MRHTNTMSEMLGFWGVCLLVVIGLSAIPAWVTHCATQITRLIDGHGDTFVNALVLVIGAIFAPAGVIHGWLIWFGIA